MCAGYNSAKIDDVCNVHEDSVRVIEIGIVSGFCVEFPYDCKEPNAKTARYKKQIVLQ